MWRILLAPEELDLSVYPHPYPSSFHFDSRLKEAGSLYLKACRYAFLTRQCIRKFKQTKRSDSFTGRPYASTKTKKMRHTALCTAGCRLMWRNIGSEQHVYASSWIIKAENLNWIVGDQIYCLFVLWNGTICILLKAALSQQFPGIAISPDC